MAQSNGCLLRSTIRDVSRSLSQGDTSVAKLCQQSLKLIDKSRNLNSFITVCGNKATHKAAHLDEKLATNEHDCSRNPLFGVPISIKDNFCTNQVLTTCASKMLQNFVPTYTATAVSRLEAANCIIMGKTNMDEFAMGSSSFNSFYGPTANYWKSQLSAEERPIQSDPKKWFMAGGSSTGSAISVASGACLASLGTDTGGSTRQPASLTGVVGFKPTYGLISRFGMIPLAHCLDVVSILAKNVDDVHLVFDTVIGQDEHDLTSVDHRTELKCKFAKNNNGNFTIRVGIPDDFVSRGDISIDVSRRFDETIEHLSNNRIGGNIDVEVIKINLKHARYATECYTIISSAEIASNMSCYDGVKYGLATVINSSVEFDRDQFFKNNRDEGFGSEVKKRILIGNYFLLSGNREKYLDQALKTRRLISEEFNKVFTDDGIDVILMPSTPTTSASHEEWLRKFDDNKLFHEDYFLIPSNLANLPSISLPHGLSSQELPVGMQLIANRFCDLDLLFLSKIFEEHVFQRVR